MDTQKSELTRAWAIQMLDLAATGCRVPQPYGFTGVIGSNGCSRSGRILTTCLPGTKPIPSGTNLGLRLTSYCNEIRRGTTRTTENGIVPEHRCVDSTIPLKGSLCTVS
jgi:hypothetical protein